MTQLAWILLLMLLGWVGGLALLYRHYRRERARKLAELNAYWDALIAGEPVTRPPWLPEREPSIEEEFDVTQ